MKVIKSLATVPLCALAICLSLASFVWAAPTTSVQAVKVVEGWLALESSPLGEQAGSVSGVAAFDGSGKAAGEGNAVFYAVSLTPRGVVILPADDLVEPLVAFLPNATGYSANAASPFDALVIRDIVQRVAAVRSTTRGAAEPAATPSQMKWRSLSATNATTRGRSADSLPDVRVAPLLESTWNQETFEGKPLYNYYTPNGYPCGCTATAMGQVLRYFEYPVNGIGVENFAYEVDGVAVSSDTLGGDGKGGPYKWSEMPPKPDANITDAQRQNIGALLYDIGIAIGSSYGPASAGGTGANLFAVTDDLNEVFGYENAMVIAKPGTSPSDRQLPLDLLQRAINSNLDAALPIILGLDDQAGQAGHAVVADGYGYSAGTMYHHINLGWGGEEDAWYALPVIDDKYVTFDVVDECVYNIYTKGTGEIVSGRVLDKSGNPLEGVAVTMSGGSWSATDTSDARGIFAFAYAPSNTTFTIFAAKSGYEFKRLTGVKTGLSEVDVDVTPYVFTCGNVWGVEVREGQDAKPSSGSSGCDAGTATVVLLLIGTAITLRRR